MISKINIVWIIHCFYHFLVYPPQTPWNYTGPFYISATLNPSFGNGVSSFSGRSFGVLNGSATISQDMTGLHIGQQYFISWLQLKDPNAPASIGLNVSVEHDNIFSEPDINSSYIWIFRSSSVFIASSSTMSLEFVATGSELSGLGIDSIEVNIFYNIIDPWVCLLHFCFALAFSYFLKWIWINA